MDIIVEYIIFFGFWIFLFAFIAIVSIWAIWWFGLTSKNVRRLRHSIRNKIPSMVVGFDDGHLEIRYATDILAEGIIKSKLAKKIFNFIVARGSGDKKTDKPINNLMTKVFHMDGVPQWHGYAGKAIAANIKTLATYEYANPNTEQKFNIAGQEYSVFFPVDMRTLKKAFDKSWNQAQVRSLEITAEQQGFEEAKSIFKGDFTRWMPLFIVLALILGICAILFFIAGAL